MKQYTDQEISHIKSADIVDVHGQSLYDYANNQWVAWGMTTVFNIIEKTILNIQALNNSIDGYKYTFNEHQAKFNEINKIAKDTNYFLKKFINNQNSSHLINAMKYGLFPGGKKMR